MIDLRRLQVLRVLHEQGTVTATAQALYLTPSAVSQQLRQLSREVGVELLCHEGRRVRLTPAAYTLLEHAHTIYAEWERTRAELAAHADGGLGRLRLCGFSTAFDSLLVPAAARLRGTDPRLTVHITEADADECAELLLADDADIAVVPVAGCPPLDDPRFDQRVLLDDPQDLVVPAGHPLAGHDEVELAAAARETWIAPHHDQHQLIVVACAAAGFTPRVAHAAQEWNSVLALVAAGLGICLLPRLAAVPPERHLVRVPLRGQPVPSRRILVGVRRGSREQPSIARGLAVLDEIRDDRRSLETHP